MAKVLRIIIKALLVLVGFIIAANGFHIAVDGGDPRGWLVVAFAALFFIFGVGL